MAEGNNKRYRPYPKVDDKTHATTVVAPITAKHAVQLREPEKRARIEKKNSVLRAAEDELLKSAMGVLGHAVNFAQIPFDCDVCPPELKEKHGEKAEEAFRLMKAGQMASKDAPVGLQVAQKVAAAISKSRSLEKDTHGPLNIAVQVVMQAPQYEEMDLDE